MNYMIDVKETGATIERRYSDFANLRLELIKSYPGYVIPPIPKKKVGKTMEPAFLTKRQELLQQFLNEVLEHPVLKNSQLVSQFLTLSDKEWEAKIKCISKLSGVKDVNDFRTTESCANIELTEENEKYCEKLQPLIETVKGKYKAIKDYNKSIMVEFDKLSELFTMTTMTYKGLANTFSSLGDNTLSVLYEYISDLNKRLGEMYKAFREVIMSELVSYYRFHKYDIEALVELIITQKNTGILMNSLEKKLWSKKESKFAQKNIATWDLNPNIKITPEVLVNDKTLAFQEMLHKETVEARKSRISYGYYTNKVIEEFTRITKKNWVIAKDHFTAIPPLFIEIEEELKRIWQQFLKKMENFVPGTSLGELKDTIPKIT